MFVLSTFAFDEPKVSNLAEGSTSAPFKSYTLFACFVTLTLKELAPKRAMLLQAQFVSYCKRRVRLPVRPPNHIGHVPIALVLVPHF
mmetsp:Transcript_3695/g.9145  ORF Transcript_3695/g.9145 Transcript_3695/m.9145 type:complete len:87 (-) Transcript_3695:816-1076(-)